MEEERDCIMHMLSDLTSSAKYQEVKMAAGDCKGWI